MSDRLSIALENLRQKAAEQKTWKDHLGKSLQEHQDRLQRLEAEVQLHHEARELLVQAAKVSREKTIGFVDKAVTHAVRSVFQDKSLEFKIEIHERRGAIEADYKISWLANGVRITDDPMDAKGGSVQDTVATALRLVFLSRFKPQRRKILIMDEPAKFIDPEHVSRYAKWLRRVAIELEIQVIIITHKDAMIQAADKVFFLKKNAKTGSVSIKSKKGTPSLAGYGFKKEAAK